MRVHEILSLLAEDGWEVVTTRGSHRQLKHPTKSGPCDGRRQALRRLPPEDDGEHPSSGRVEAMSELRRTGAGLSDPDRGRPAVELLRLVARSPRVRRHWRHGRGGRARDARRDRPPSRRDRRGRRGDSGTVGPRRVHRAQASRSRVALTEPARFLSFQTASANTRVAYGLQQKGRLSAALQKSLQILMELGGLEPPTSWVRSRAHSQLGATRGDGTRIDTGFHARSRPRRSALFRRVTGP